MFSHILVPLDGSHFAESALPHALELAQKFNSQITLLRSIAPAQPFAADVGDTAEMLIKLRELSQEEAEQYLASHTGSLDQQGYKINYSVQISGSPANTILSTAEEQGADVIVMSTHGRSGLGRFLFGSVAEKIMRHAEIPVLLIRAKEQPDN